MKCPGQDSRYWKPGAIFESHCPKCGHTVEFFKDDTTRLCKACGNRILNPSMDFGCASYCQYAEQCIGDLPPELLAQKENLLKDRVAIEMKRYLKKDFKRIGHATRVARYAEKLGRKEQGNLAVILPAAYLSDLVAGLPGERAGTVEGPGEREGEPQAAREILESLGANGHLIEEVCDLIRRRRHPGEEEGVNLKCLHDADVIGRLEERQKDDPVDGETLETILGRLLTESGKELAKEVFKGGTP
jgi:hypothetical protein